MSIARAFTTRRVKQSLHLADGDSAPHRSNTVAKGPIGSLRQKSSTSVLRHKISAPLELVHTTNMLSYNAPDLFPTTSSTTSSARSDDGMSDAPTNASSPPTSPDVPPQRSMSPEPNHLSCYFTAPAQAAAPAAPAAAREDAQNIRPSAPVIPQRAPSHTKKASYEALNRHRSASRMSEQSNRTVSTNASFTFSRSSSASTSTTATSHMSVPTSHQQHASKPTPSVLAKMAPLPPLPPPTTTLPTPPKVQYQHKKEYTESHPFGQELAQVSELVEEFGVTDKSTGVAEEEQGLVAKGLFKFSAEDYLAEIQGLLVDYLGSGRDARPVAALWI